MRRTISITFILVLCIFLCSCRELFREEYSYMNPKEDISSISIISAEMTEDGELLETELCKIDEIDEFLDDFSKVKCYQYIGDPVSIKAEEYGEAVIVIKFKYKNGEYELINYNGQTDFSYKLGFRYYAGFNTFDKEQFEELLSKYLD